MQIETRPVPTKAQRGDEPIPLNLPMVPVVAFGGVEVSISRDGYWPLLFAKANGVRVRFLLFGRRFVGSQQLAPAQHRALKRWLSMRDPVWRRTAAHLAFDQWLRARNGKSIDKLPGPDGLLPANTPPTAFDGRNLYRIDHGEALADYKLKVTFTNGETRIVDVWQMVGHLPMFGCVFEQFRQAKFTPFHVEWPDPAHKNTMEIENQDLWGAGDLVPPNP